MNPPPWFAVLLFILYIYLVLYWSDRLVHDLTFRTKVLLLAIPALVLYGLAQTIWR